MIMWLERSNFLINVIETSDHGFVIIVYYHGFFRECYIELCEKPWY